MRILKKSLALLIAITMVLGLVTISVSADAPTAKFTLKFAGAANTGVAYKTAGLTSLSFDLFFSAADGSDITTGGFAYQMVYPDWVNSAVVTDKIQNATDNNIPFAYKAGVALSLQNGATQEIDADTKIATITLNFDDGELAALETITLTANTQTATVGDGEGFTGEVMDTAEGQGSYTLTLEDAVELTGIVEEINITDKKVGTAQNALGLPATVTATAVKAVGGSAAANVPDVAVTWSGYDPLALTEQHLTGTLTDPDGDGEGVSIASDAVIEATVDLLPLVTEDTTVTITVDEDALEVKEGETKTAEEVAAIVKAAITKIEFTGNGLTREISKDAANINFNKAEVALDGTEVIDTEIAITVEFNDVDSEDGIFDGVVKTDAATIALTIVPAEIEDAAVTIEGATTADDYVKVKASLPVEALTAIPVTAIHGAGYKAESAAAKAAIEAMKLAMGRAADDVETSDVDIKTMYVGLNNLEESAVYSIKVFKADGTEVDLSNTSMEYTAVKDEVVFYWTFNQESPNAATEDVVDGGVYTIKAYKGDEEIDSIDVTVGEDDVLGDAPVVYDGTFTLAVDEGSAVKEIHDNANDIVLSAEIQPVVKDGVATATIELVSDKKLKNILSDDSVDSEFTVSVYYNNAALVVGTTEGGANILGVTGKIMAVGDNTTVGGIGIPTTPAKPMTPVTPDEPGTEEPGTEEPGTEEPGTEEPGTDAPAIDTPIEGAPFGDITEEYRWAVDSIATLKDLGVINGNENGDFVPAGEITRAEFTKMMVVLLGLEITEEAPAFADCAADAWFAPYVAAAAKAGIINGVSETEFAPDATITREQACTILGRALGLTDAEVEAAFTDAGEISDYAESFVAALAKLGIINGYEDGSFAPANNITRAEAAKILAGALGVIAPTDAPAAE